MAVVFDAKPTAYNSSDGLNQEVVGATSISAAAGMTIGGSSNLLTSQLVFANGNSTVPPTGVTMTWNSISMNQEVLISSTSLPNTATSAQFSLASPATGAKTLAAAWTTAQDCYMSCASWVGAAVDAAGTTSNTQSTSLSINTTSDGATVACFAVDGATPTVNQTQIWAEAPDNPGGGASYAIGGSGSNSHTFTGAGGVRQVITGLKLVSSAAPTINTQPTNQTAYAGQTATFNVTATASSGALSYQWVKNGSNVGTNSNSYTTGTLTLADNASTVRCDVTDSNGTTSTITVYLFVWPTAAVAWMHV